MSRGVCERQPTQYPQSSMSIIARRLASASNSTAALMTDALERPFDFDGAGRASSSSSSSETIRFFLSLMSLLTGAGTCFGN